MRVAYQNIYILDICFLDRALPYEEVNPYEGVRLLCGATPKGQGGSRSDANTGREETQETAISCLQHRVGAAAGGRGRA